MEKGFNKFEFIDYLQGEYEGITLFTRETIDNIIEYAHKNEHVSKDMFVQFVSDMIAEVEFGEVAMFMADECLTENGIKEKNKWLKKMEEK